MEPINEKKRVKSSQKSSKKVASNEHWMSKKRDKSIEGFQVKKQLCRVFGYEKILMEFETIAVKRIIEYYINILITKKNILRLFFKGSLQTDISTTPFQSGQLLCLLKNMAENPWIFAVGSVLFFKTFVPARGRIQGLLPGFKKGEKLGENQKYERKKEKEVPSII